MRPVALSVPVLDVSVFVCACVYVCTSCIGVPTGDTHSASLLVAPRSMALGEPHLHQAPGFSNP